MSLFQHQWTTITYTYTMQYLWDVSADRNWMHLSSKKKQLKLKTISASFFVSHIYLVCTIFLVYHPVFSVQWRLNLVFCDVIGIVLRRSLRGYCADSRTLRKFDLMTRTRRSVLHLHCQQSRIAVTIIIIITIEIMKALSSKSTSLTMSWHVINLSVLFITEISDNNNKRFPC